MQCWARTPGNHIRDMGTGCVIPLLLTTADGISLPVQQEALHSLGGFFLPSTSQLEYTHKYVLLNTSVCVLVHVSRDFQPAYQELTSSDTWEHSSGTSKHFPHQMDSDCKISPWTTWPHTELDGLWLQGLGFLNYTNKSNSGGSSFGAPHSNAVKWNDLGPIGSQSPPMLKTYGHCYLWQNQEV